MDKLIGKKRQPQREAKKEVERKIKRKSRTIIDLPDLTSSDTSGSEYSFNEA